MGLLCDFCGKQRSMIYCRPDAACLCLSCDRGVHAANALSCRHLRTLLCGRCNSQPAIVRCIEENISLCRGCDWSGHGGSASALGHKMQPINSYSGCPSSAELSRLWSFALEIPPILDSNCQKVLGMISVGTNSFGNCCGPSNGRDNDLGANGELSTSVGSSLKFVENPLPFTSDQQARLIDPTTPKVCNLIWNYVHTRITLFGAYFVWIMGTFAIVIFKQINCLLVIVMYNVVTFKRNVTSYLKYEEKW